jgi:hypothetical protein
MVCPALKNLGCFSLSAIDLHTADGIVDLHILILLLMEHHAFDVKAGIDIKNLACDRPYSRCKPDQKA